MFGIAIIAIYTLFPNNYHFQLVIGPELSEKGNKFSYKLMISNDFSADSDVIHLQDFGKFPTSLSSIQDWVGQNSTNINPSNKIQVITIGRMYCNYCLDLYPYLNLMNQRYGNDIVVAGILYEKYPGELDREKIQKHIEDNAIGFPIGLDPDSNFVHSLGEEFVPVTYVIDKNGIIVLHQVGLGNFDRIDDVLQVLVKKEKK